MQSMTQFLKKDGTSCSSHCMSLQQNNTVTTTQQHCLKQYGIIYVMG